VGKVVDRLNETRDIGQFLAGMRGLLLEEMKA
jgi:Chromosome segregation protein Spc25